MGSTDSVVPVAYSVEITRDGRASAVRTVRASQHGTPTFALMASFHLLRPTTLSHGMPSPIDILPSPESMTAKLSDETADAIYQDILKTSEASGSETSVHAILEWLRYNGLRSMQLASEEIERSPLRFIIVSPDQVKRNSTEIPTEFRQYVVIKPNGAITDDKRTNAIAMSYASDHDLINTTVRSHEDSSHIDAMVSLDHTIYFHDVRSPKICLIK
jgi:acyl-CoA thioesterase II